MWTCSATQLPIIEVCIAEKPSCPPQYAVKVFTKDESDGVKNVPELEKNSLPSLVEAESYIENLKDYYKVTHLRCAETFRSR